MENVFTTYNEAASKQFILSQQLYSTKLIKQRMYYKKRYTNTSK